MRGSAIFDMRTYSVTNVTASQNSCEAKVVASKCGMGQ